MKLALLTNPTAGRGRGTTYAQLAAPVLATGAHVANLASHSAQDAASLARQAVADGVDALVVVGGDGMVNIGANAVANSETALGIIPAGTGNDVARYFDLPRRDPVAAAQRVLAAQTRTIDLAQVGERYFVTVLAAGFDALVNERANAMTWPKGQMRYNLATLLELKSLRALHYVATFDGSEEEFDANLVAIGNGPSFGGGLRITQGAILDDGQLDVVVISPISRRELLRTYPKLFAGTHTGHPHYRHLRVREVSLDSPGIVAYADGERLGPLPLTVRCAPAALRVLV